MKFHARNYFFYLTIVFLLLVFPVTGNAKETTIESQQSNGPTILCITSVPNTSSFPNIVVNFKMIDGTLSPITDLDERDFRFSENEKPEVLLSSLLPNSTERVGIDYYVIIDKGNRTSQNAVKNILLKFLDYFDGQNDNIKIYTDEKNTANLY